MSKTAESSGLPLRDSGVECGNCGSEMRRPHTNHCAGCGRFAPDPIYAHSKLSGEWYRVFEYEDLGDGKICAKSKEEVPREDVPQEWIDALTGDSSSPGGDRHDE